jgi:predicted DNA-binding protein YlxM (UPF0122 family)
MSYNFEIFNIAGEGDIEVLINVGYGGFSINDIIFKERNKRALLANQPIIEESCCIGRNDQFLVEIFKELIEGKIDYKHYVYNDYDISLLKKINIETISRDAISANAWRCNEYDGAEMICIDHARIDLWKEKQSLSDMIAKIKQTSTQSISSEEKIKIIYELITYNI